MWSSAVQQKFNGTIDIILNILVSAFLKMKIIFIIFKCNTNYLKYYLFTMESILNIIELFFSFFSPTKSQKSSVFYM